MRKIKKVKSATGISQGDFLIEEISVEEMPRKLKGRYSPIYDAILALEGVGTGVKIQCEKGVVGSVRTFIYRRYPDKYDIWWRNGYLYAKLNPFKNP